MVGIYGVGNVAPISLLETGARTGRMDHKTKVLLQSMRSTTSSIELLEKRAFQAILGGSELLEDAQHCSQEEITEKCAQYTNETNDVLAAYQEFLCDLNEKQTYFINRVPHISIIGGHRTPLVANV